MDTIIFEFIASLAADADLRRLRPDICEQAAALLSDDIVLKMLKVSITDNRPAANC